ncbi:hypothetical protein LCGC14_0108220 [marine sediment metagenome]|uniref:GrpB family protein n=1 Tax=marine sediment metagenome TaxID=412755 RepID=A0A0F9VB70_9ZZZZ|nr:GrpB family protein [Halomonas sp.]HDZ47682.1 GrpB family protein [Halomonas sp.]
MKLGVGIGSINIAEHSPSWRKQFLRESNAIRSAMSDKYIYIDHVGSTSVKGLSSKPIIDILISLTDWKSAAEIVTKLEGLGYCISEKCDDVPRYFLTKYSSNDSGCFHVHICQPHCRWGRDMLIFRNELESDSELALNYVSLKKQLAKNYYEDVTSYMLGKKDFIESRLRETASEFSVNKLLAHQRAESDKAERLQIFMMLAQLLIALTAAVSVYSRDNKYLFLAAIFGFIIMLFWLFFSKAQQRYRSSGDQARRAVLIMSGLGLEPPAGQKLRISDGFNATISKKTLRREEDHFSSREAPSYKRLSEMIEESSYWTRDLQQASAKVMIITLLFLAAIVSVIGGAAIASLESNSLMSLSRAMIAIMIFVISSDSLGLLLAYRSSAVTIDEIFKRVENVASRGYSESDVLLLMSDYNAAIERAPTPLPWIYKFRQRRLSLRWQAYVEAKLSSKTGI